MAIWQRFHGGGAEKGTERRWGSDEVAVSGDLALPIHVMLLNRSIEG